MNNTIYRQQAIDAMCDACSDWCDEGVCKKVSAIQQLPSAEPEYEPVTAEDFAKTMSENTICGFMAWHGKALELMERQGFVICKKTM